MIRSQRAAPPSETLLLFATAATFGASPLLISLTVEHFPPWQLAALRAALGCPLLLVAAFAMGQIRRPEPGAVVTAMVAGVLIVAAPFVLMAAGMQYIPSGLGGMLYASMPIFTLALTFFFAREERIRPADLARVAVGLTGVCLIAGPSLVADGLAAAGLGAALTLLAPLSYAAGNVWLRQRQAVPPLLLNAGMFAAGAVITLPMALVIDGLPSTDTPAIALVLLVVLIAAATVLPAVLNYLLIRRAGANKAALVMFLMPGFALLYGAVFLGERSPLVAFTGLLLVVAAATSGTLGRARLQPRADGKET
jgi:drug/metabolite transporter (DMT)-like permease